MKILFLDVAVHRQRVIAGEENVVARGASRNCARRDRPGDRRVRHLGRHQSETAAAAAKKAFSRFLILIVVVVVAAVPLVGELLGLLHYRRGAQPNRLAHALMSVCDQSPEAAVNGLPRRAAQQWMSTRPVLGSGRSKGCVKGRIQSAWRRLRSMRARSRSGSMSSSGLRPFSDAQTRARTSTAGNPRCSQRRAR